MLMTTRKAQLGLNLVELMIGLVVGMIVVAAMTTVYLNASRSSKDTLNANRLNQDLRAVMDIMVADIRRGGYWGTAQAGKTNCFTLRGASADCGYLGANRTDIYIPSSDCILYSYDAVYKGGTAGTANSGTDFFGFKRNSNAVWLATNFGNTNQANCTGNLGWQQLTDSAVISIDALTFSTGVPPVPPAPPNPDDCDLGLTASTEPGSRCLNTNTGATWSEGVDGTTPACADTAAAGYVAPSNGDELAETRQITICIKGTHVSDPTLTRTLRETVLVRNNRLCTFDGTNCI